MINLIELPESCFHPYACFFVFLQEESELLNMRVARDMGVAYLNLKAVALILWFTACLIRNYSKFKFGGGAF